VHNIVLTVVGGEESTLHVLWERLVDIQEGRVKWEGWGVLCAVANTAQMSTISTPTLHPNNTDTAS